MNLSNKYLMCRKCKSIIKFGSKGFRTFVYSSLTFCLRCAFIPHNQKALEHHFIEIKNPKLARLFYV